MSVDYTNSDYTVADGSIASTIARDTETATALSTAQGNIDSAMGLIANISGTTAGADLAVTSLKKAVGIEDGQTLEQVATAQEKAATALTAILTDYGTSNTVQTSGLADSAVTAAKVASDVATQAELAAVDTAYQTADTTLTANFTSLLAAVDTAYQTADTTINAKLDGIATYTDGNSDGDYVDTGDTVVLKAIDASNAKASGEALSSIKAGEDANTSNGSTTFMDFVRRLFGGA